LIAPLEAEVRELLGNAIFAADDETMEHVVGKLLRARQKSVAVYEDLSCGQLAERLQTASPELFAGGVIHKFGSATRALLNHGRDPERGDDLLQEQIGKAACRGKGGREGGAGGERRKDTKTER